MDHRATQPAAPNNVSARPVDPRGAAQLGASEGIDGVAPLSDAHYVLRRMEARSSQQLVNRDRMTTHDFALSQEPNVVSYSADPSCEGSPANDDTNRVPAPSRYANDTRLLWFLLSTTGLWVIAGVVVMFTGIISLRFGLLPRIHTCPPGATCPHSYDPRGQILRVVQTVMLYWLRSGCLIAGVGIIKVIAYQASFFMNRRGSTIRSLELNLATIHGNASKAALLIWERRNFTLGLPALMQLAIFTVVPLVVDRSIIHLSPVGRVRANFTYPERFTFSSTQSNSVSMSKVSVAIDLWLLDHQTYPLDDYHGTFVVRDNRTLFAVDAQPGGSRISGTVSCSSSGISTTALPPQPRTPGTWYNISYGGQWITTSSLTALGSAFLGPNVSPIVSTDNTSVSFHILWTSNKPGQIVNGTSTRDGRIHVAQCIHTIDLSPIQDENRDHIRPSSFYLPPQLRAGAIPVCAGGHDEACLKVYVGYIITSFWSSVNERISLIPGQIIGMYKYCQRGALTGLQSEQPDETCIVDSRSWTELLAFAANAITRTSEKDGTMEQEVRIEVESVDRGWWWLQTLIPGLTLLVYIASVTYVFSLNRRRDVLNELSVPDILLAALSNREVRDCVQQGGSITELTVGGSSTDEPPSTESGTLKERVAMNADTGRTMSRTNRTRLGVFILQRTGYAVLAGIVFMFAGIVILRFTLLPRIYTCPAGATCRHSFDPHGQILRTVQTVMLYWLQAGCLISGVGLVKVIAYHGWIVMKKSGNTVKMLGLKLATVHGSAAKGSMLLFWKHSQRLLPLFALVNIAISSIVALVVNRSISKLESIGLVKVDFSYPEHFSLPHVVLPGAVSSSPSFGRPVSDSYAQWLMGDNYSYPHDNFSGTFVVRDNRTTFALDAQPGGSRVSGTISCSANNITSVILPHTPARNYTGYNITYNDLWSIYLSSVFLGSAFVREPFVRVSDRNHTVVAMEILWMSNTTGTIENGTTTRDGKVSVAICMHTVELLPIPDKHLDHIQPSLFFAPPEARNGSNPVCAKGDNDNVCLALIIANYVFFQWGDFGPGSLTGGRLATMMTSCVRGAFTSIYNSLETSCRVDTQAWTVTLTALTEALLRTSQRSGNATQALWVAADSISRRQWWLQALIPCATFALYLACVVYAVSLNPETETLKELSLSEIITAACLDQKDVLAWVRNEGPIDLVTVGGRSRPRVSGGE